MELLEEHQSVVICCCRFKEKDIFRVYLVTMLLQDYTCKEIFLALILRHKIIVVTLPTFLYYDQNSRGICN